MNKNKTLANDFLQISTINKKCRFWMLRTNNGMYFDEFIRDEYVAIGWKVVKYFLERDHNKEKDLLSLQNQELQNEKLYWEIEALKSDIATCKNIENAAKEISQSANKLEIITLKNRSIDVNSITSEIEKM